MERVGQNASVVRQDKGTRHLTARARVCAGFPYDFRLRHSDVRASLERARSAFLERARLKLSRPVIWRMVSGVMAVLAGAVVLASSGRILHLQIILTDSAAPAGIYRLIAATPVRGALVAACLPAAAARTGLARGYLQAGDCPGGVEPVAKVLGALPGDEVQVAPDGVAVNGVPFANSQTAAHDRAGRPLAHVAWGARRVDDGEVWLFGFHNRRSWDARYFGAVPLAAVRGALRPVVRW
jgi:conjugative transfer signal peptidase TraF